MPDSGPAAAGKIKVGVSSCLLGEPVRYDGGHRLDALLTQECFRGFVWVPICPELEAGLGVPREAMQLTGSEADPRLLGVASGRDWTVRLLDFCKRRLDELAAAGLCGFVFKSNSPSCGAFQVRVYAKPGVVGGFGAGLFAAAFQKRFPAIPVEEETRLLDPTLRERFVASVSDYRQLVLRG
jgi:uncharacterized protein YbbK (DUF523 family)